MAGIIMLPESKMAAQCTRIHQRQDCWLLHTHPFSLLRLYPLLRNFHIFLSCSWVSSTATVLKFCFHYNCGETGLSWWHYPIISMFYLKNLFSTEMLWTNFPIPQTYNWELISRDIELKDGFEQNQFAVSFNFSQDFQYGKWQSYNIWKFLFAKRKWNTCF